MHEIARVLSLHRDQVHREPLLHASRQHRHSVLLPFTAPNRDLVAIEVEVLDTECEALFEANARTVQHRHDEPHRAVNLWFCVDALTLWSTASHARNATSSVAPMVAGCFFR